ncbi:hypothetical protein J4E08_00460 [Sagittula sp. NFXS13]|uniref:Uncharacterized protein n=1 Tax=Sagittula marina TaxID=943940 RepID=A0A7W6DMH2_9RHOB|nr:hypothetical protein [Sagittula marina]MBB3985733.1 hypothetical protein [Sagittula marina]
MTEEIDATEVLKAERNLLFHELRSGPSRDAVTLWVDGAEVAEQPIPDAVRRDNFAAIPGPIHTIDSEPGCLRYRLMFTRCVAYQWRDEAYAEPEPSDDTEDSPLRLYPQSRYRAQVEAASFAHQVYQDPFHHFAVLTLDAILDVICRQPPRVTARVLTEADLR